MANRSFTQEEINQITEIFSIWIDKESYSISITLEASEANLYFNDLKKGNRDILWILIDTNMSDAVFIEQLNRFKAGIQRVNQNYGVVGHG